MQPQVLSDGTPCMSSHAPAHGVDPVTQIAVFAAPDAPPVTSPGTTSMLVAAAIVYPRRLTAIRVMQYLWQGHLFHSLQSRCPCNRPVASPGSAVCMKLTAWYSAYCSACMLQWQGREQPAGLPTSMAFPAGHPFGHQACRAPAQWQRQRAHAQRPALPPAALRCTHGAFM